MPTDARAVRYDHHGGIDVLRVEDVSVPDPTGDQVLVEVRAAGVNPGEAAIREGAMEEMFPSTFPSGQGSDLAGVVVALGPDATGVSVGEEVLGWSMERNSQATHVLLPSGQLVPKPEALSWEVAGGLYVVGCTAYAAVRAVDPQPGETVVVSAAAGGVGSLVTQMLAARDVTVLALASEDNHEWLTAHGATPLTYGEGLADRVREAAPDGVDALIDLFGPEYVDLGLELGVAPERIETIISFERAGEVGAKAEGSAEATTTEVLSLVAGLVADGGLVLEVAATYPLDEVAAAYTELEQRHTRGKIVLTTS